MKAATHRTGWALAVLTCFAASSQAQWLTQDFALEPGWNSVFLEVDPSPQLADELLDGLPIEAVWTRVPQRIVDGPPDCADPDDPNCTPPDASAWWVWVPADDPHAVVRTLRLIRGGRVYLIKASAAAALEVTGRPSSAVVSWREGFNLAGFHVVDEAGSAPTFASYLSGSAVHANAAVFSISPSGAPTAVATPGTTKIAAGVGYWVASAADTEYGGPMEFERSSLRGVDFGRELLEHYFGATNRTSSPRNVTLAYVGSDPVPAGGATLAGDVPLSYLEYQSGQVENALQWHELTSQSWSMASAGQAGARRTIRLGVQRAGLAPATVDTEGQGALYQGLLRATDGEGFERWLAVSTEVLAGAGGSVAGVGSPRPGLYFGHVTADEVSWITAGAPVWTNDDPTDPTFEANPDGDTLALRPAPAEFSFPVMIHVSETGGYTMLTEVTLLWQPGDAKLGTAGEFVLATPACAPAVCDALEAGSIQDGQPFARRIATAAFSFDGDLSLSGDFSSALAGQTVVPADHRLNPFRHRYHADHDCDQQGECMEITRSFEFAFATEPPAGLDTPAWGDSVVAGTYSETLSGLHKDPIGVRGRFELRRIVNVATLNAN